MSKKQIDINSIRKIAVYLEGIKQGKGGNILPLGNIDLEQLWDAIDYLQGSKDYEVVR
jgi:hypothetical protein